MIRSRRTLAVVAAVVLAACTPTGPGGSAPRAVTIPDSTVAAAIALERSLLAGEGEPAAERPVIAVLPFTAFRGDTLLVPIGYALADLTAVDLARSSRLTVVERVRLDAVLREIALAQAGILDEFSAPRAGRLLAAERLVLGAVTRARPEDFNLDLRISEVALGAVTGAVSGEASIDALFDAQKAAVFQLFDVLGVTLTPAERRRIEDRPTRSLAALVAYGKGRRYEVLGDYTSAAREYRNAQSLDADFGAPFERTQIVAGLEPFSRPATERGDGAVGQRAVVAARPLTADAVVATDGSATTSVAGAAGAAAPSLLPIAVPNQRGAGQGQARSPLGSTGLVIDRINRPLDQLIVTPAPGPTNPTPTDALPVVRIPIIIIVRP